MTFNFNIKFQKKKKICFFFFFTFPATKQNSRKTKQTKKKKNRNYLHKSKTLPIFFPNPQEMKFKIIIIIESEILPSIEGGLEICLRERSSITFSPKYFLSLFFSLLSSLSQGARKREKDDWSLGRDRRERPFL